MNASERSLTRLSSVFLARSSSFGFFLSSSSSSSLLLTFYTLLNTSIVKPLYCRHDTVNQKFTFLFKLFVDVFSLLHYFAYQRLHSFIKSHGYVRRIGVGPVEADESLVHQRPHHCANVRPHNVDPEPVVSAQTATQSTDLDI